MFSPDRVPKGEYRRDVTHWWIEMRPGRSSPAGPACHRIVQQSRLWWVQASPAFFAVDLDLAFKDECICFFGD